MRTSTVLLLFFIVVCFAFVQNVYGQNEITPLPLDKLNRDSLDQIIRQKEKAKDYKALGIIYGGMYNHFLYSSFRDSALFYAGKAEENTLKAGDSLRYYFIQIQLGEFNAGKDSATAVVYYKKAFDYYWRTRNYTMQGHALGGLSYLYGLHKDTANLINYLNRAEKVNEIVKDTFHTIGAADRRAHILINRNKIDSAIALIKKNLWLIEHAKKLGNSESIRIFWKGLQLNLLADCYYRKKDYSSAIETLKQAQEYDKQTSTFDAQNSIRYHLLVSSYIRANEKDSAVKYLDEFFDQTIEIYNNINPEKLREITAKYETEKKQRQIDQLQQQNNLQQLKVSNQRKLNLAFIGISCLLLIIGYLIIRNIQHKKKIAIEWAKQRAELEKKQLVESERVRISTELHDDVGGELSAIRLVSEMAQSDKMQNPQQQFSKISASSAELVQKMNEIVWALNVNNDTLQSLVAYMHRYATKYLDDVGIECRFTQPAFIPAQEVDGVVRRNIFLLVKEAIHNAVKHARASCVSIDINVDHCLRITVHDNGKGIAQEALTDTLGNGLRTMQKRAKDLNGTVEITVRNGTTVTFALPLTEAHTKV